MARRVFHRLRRCFSFIQSVGFVLCTLALVPSYAHAQVPAVAGVVVDEADAVIPNARITVLSESGGVVRTTTTDAAGNFLLPGLAPGTYTVLAERALFVPATAQVALATGGVPPLRLILMAGGFKENVVVTGRRVESRVAETPQKVEIIDAADIERTVAVDITDVLKKNAGVDIIQYTGALSGIGIRGFRPQFSGLNKRSLLLVDGRPSGVTNLATLLVDGVDRIEVLKGAASAVYGSSAMGGVVNVITRQSRGKVSGNVRAGGGSFGTTELAGRAGGNLTSRIDFDANANVFNQRDDIRMGNGVVRPATRYKTYDGGGRIGVDLGPGWRLDGHAGVYRGVDISSPPDIVAGNIGQSSKDIDRNNGDGRISGRIGAHDVTITGYRATEASHTTNVTTSNPLDLPFLPFLSFESELAWTGGQVRDSLRLSRFSSVVLGFDFERVSSISRTYARTGDRTAPFSSDANKRTAGVYAEHTLRLAEGKTVVALGGRLDRITTATLLTPLRTNFTPSETSFNVFNPSLGIKQAIAGGLRGHFGIGRAFIPAEASMLTGFTTTVVGGRTQISQGNPNLRPERSTSFDIGAEFTSAKTRFDVTTFRTVVKDRFISNVTISNPAPPEPIILSIVNGLDAHISGLEVEGEQRVGGRVGLFGNVTHYFNRKERLASGLEQDILNVPMNTVRLGVDLDFGHLSTRVSGRYVEGRRDNDFNAPGFPIVDYTNFTVVDLSATYTLAGQHAVTLAVNNLFDTFYYEKLGYPLQGASFRLGYRLGF